MKKSESEKLQRVAVFDIDGTIFRSCLLVELVDELVRVGIFPYVAKHEIEGDYLAWRNRKGDYGNYISQVVDCFLKYIKGCDKNDVDKVILLAIDHHKDRLYTYTKSLIEYLKQ